MPRNSSERARSASRTFRWSSCAAIDPSDSLPRREPTGNPVGKPKGSNCATRKLEHRKPDETIPLKPERCKKCSTALGEPIETQLVAGNFSHAIRFRLPYAGLAHLKILSISFKSNSIRFGSFILSLKLLANIT